MSIDKSKKFIEMYMTELYLAEKYIDENLFYSIRYLIDVIVSSYEEERNVFLCGNGGTVGLIENLYVDLLMHPFASKNKNVIKDIEKRLKVYNLCSSNGLLTGISNDIGFENVFSEQLKIFAKSGDTLICCSGSGMSKNIVKAIEFALKKQMNIFIVTRNQNISPLDFTKDDSYLSKYITIITYPSLGFGKSKFPGQTDGNYNNFHFEDFISRLSHIVVGVLRDYVKSLDN